MKLLSVVLGPVTALVVSLPRRVKRLYADGHSGEILASAGRLTTADRADPASPA